MAKPKETEQEIVNRIMNTQGKMAHHLRTHNSILVGVSGGSDSDCIVHMIATYFREYLPKIHFVFFDTGLEYKATKEHEGIRYSDCYEIYGLKRTGCVGCLFNRKFNEELEVMKKYEPKLYNACVHVFGDAYDFTAKYRQFQKECKDAETERKLKLKVKGE